MSIPTIPSTFGPVRPSLNTLRGIRYWSDEHTAGGATGDDSGSDGANPDGGSSSSNEQSGTNQQQGSGDGGTGTSSRSSTPSPARREAETFSRKYVEELRAEAADRRKTAEKLAEEKAAAERERDETRTRLADLERRDVVRETARDAGGNAKLLLDSDRFRAALSSVDLSKPDDVKKTISDFVAANPEYGVTPGAGSSGPGRAGGSPSGKPDTSNDLQGAIAASLS